MAVIVADRLVKRYGGRAVVDEVSFAVEEGEVVAVLGPNGAGKTTLVEMLEGFRSRDGGRAEVLGHDPARPGPGFRDQLGVVLQETRPDPYLTVRETVELVRGWYREPRPADEILALVGLGDAAGQRTTRLSGGQQRRLDVALGLVGRPRLLFLDEPTTGFDPSARREAWATFAGLRDLGTTIVLTTHYLDEAAFLADRLVVLARGRVVAQGTPEAIGGRDRIHLVSFRLDAGVEPPPGGAAANGRWRGAVEDITAAVHALSEWSRATGVGLDDLTVARPALEDLYLDLIA